VVKIDTQAMLVRVLLFAWAYESAGIYRELILKADRNGTLIGRITGGRKMKKITLIAVICMVALSFGTAFAEKAPQEVVDMANTKLAEIGKNPVIVAAVKAENAKRKSLSSIQELDAKWKATPGTVNYMQALIDNACGQYLRDLQNAEAYIAEAFAMDNQGANACMTDKTSDYWQGDEAKFKNSWNDGKGGVFVDDVEFDDSAQTYVAQVSVPVVDGDKVIGAITFGVDIDQLN
jgi:hypothetical protein